MAEPSEALGDWLILIGMVFGTAGVFLFVLHTSRSLALMARRNRMGHLQSPRPPVAGRQVAPRWPSALPRAYFRDESPAEEARKPMAAEMAITSVPVVEAETDRSHLIQVLLERQHQNGWLSEDTIKGVSRELDVPLSQIYHVATFYKAFSLVPKGRHIISVCLGTACQVRGAPRLVDRVAKALKIRPGQTSTDMRYSLDTVNCLGCCALGPVMVVDGKYYSKPSTKDLEQVAALD